MNKYWSARTVTGPEFFELTTLIFCAETSVLPVHSNLTFSDNILGSEGVDGLVDGSVAVPESPEPVGYMLGLGKDVLLLKDKNGRTFNAFSTTIIAL